MKRISAKVAADRMIAGVQAKTQKIKDGINAVDRSPGAAAADNITAMIANWLEKAQNGELEEALRGVDLAEWRAKTLDAVGRIGPGMQRSRAKIEAFFDQLLPYQEAYTAEIARMDKTTLEDSRARMNANFDRMAEFKFRKP